MTAFDREEPGAACSEPATEFLREGVANSAWSVPGVEFVDVKLSYDPPWTPQMMSPDAKADLGFIDGDN